MNTVKTPWGQRLIPVAELERFVREHLEPRRGCQAPHLAGRPPTLPHSVVERICLQYARGRSLGEIAATLNADGVPTAHGGRRWWPSTVRAVLVRSSPPASAAVSERPAGASPPGRSTTISTIRHEATTMFRTRLRGIIPGYEPAGEARQIMGHTH